MQRYAKYPTYATSITTPHGLRSSLWRIVPSHRITPAATATAESIRNLLSNGTLQINAVVPITKRMLKILLPTIFPMAIPALPLLAAVTEVTSYGSDVPKATIVRPMKRSLMPKALAISDAASTTRSLPQTTIIPPAIMKIMHFK